VRSIQGARSVTLELEPVTTKASASRGPGSDAPPRTSHVAHSPLHASPVRSRIQRSKSPRRSAISATVVPAFKMRMRNARTG
jgi:hypothetical protein